jgi:hypothetical protein
MNIQPLTNASEIHNTRRKELDYVRHDLTHLNESWVDPRYEGKTVDEIRKDIAKRYLATVGQKMQKRAEPLREGVVVIDKDTTMEQLRQLAVALEKRFGIKTMQIHIHRDEGYQNAKDWKPNLHAHMHFDWTKPNGKSLGLTKSHMAEIQTITADVLGMERGVSSDRRHLSAIHYKNKKEGERFIALQEQNAALQSDIEQYRQENEMVKVENEEMQAKAEELRRMVSQLKRDVKKMNITKKAKNFFTDRIDGMNKLLGKSDMQEKYEDVAEKLETVSKEYEVLRGKVDKLTADLERRKKERETARQETAELKDEVNDKDERISTIESELRNVRKENLRLGRIAEPHNHVLPDIVDIKSCDVMHTPRGHLLRIWLKDSDDGIFKNISYEDYEKYRKCEMSLDQLIARYATHEIDVAIAKRLQLMNKDERKVELSKLMKTMFHALPAILFPILSANIPCQARNSSNEVGLRHKSRDEIIRDMQEQGYNVGRGIG